MNSSCVTDAFSNRAHSHVSETVTVSQVGCPSVLIVKDISLFLTAQSIRLLQGEEASLSLSQQVIALAAILAECQALSSS